MSNGWGWRITSGVRAHCKPDRANIRLDFSRSDPAFQINALHALYNATRLIDLPDQASDAASGRNRTSHKAREKGPYPIAEGATGRVPGVKHVTAAEMTDEQLLALLRQQLHLLDQALGREIGCHHIVIAMRDQDLHVRVHAHGEAQVVGRASRSPKRMGWLVALPIAIDGKTQQLVAALRIDADLGAQNMIDAAGKDALNAGQGRLLPL